MPLVLVPATGSLAVQPLDTFATVLTLFEFRLQSGDFLCRVTGTLEQFVAFVQVLLAGRNGTGDQMVSTDIQSGLF